MNKVISQFSIFVLLVSIIYSCGSSDKGSVGERGQINYKAELVDSVVFERFSEVNIEAINDATNELLLFDEQQRQMLVVNEEGNLISSFDPFIEGPNYMGDRSTGWTFYGKDQVIGFGYTHFYVFSKAGKRLQRMPYPVEVAGWLRMDYSPKRVIGYEKNDKKGAVALIPGERGVSSKTQKYQDSVDVVFNLDFENDNAKPVFRKPVESVYRKGGKYLGSGYPVMDYLGEGKFVIVYEADMNIYIMDVFTNTLEKTIALPEPYWPIAEPVAFGSKTAPDLRKVVANVYAMKENFVVNVFGRIPESEFTQVMKIPNWFESPELKQLQKKYASNDMLLLNSDGFLGKIKWDLGLIGYRYFGDKNGFIWVKRTYQDERDYQTFLKIRVVPDTD